MISIVKKDINKWDECWGYQLVSDCVFQSISVGSMWPICRWFLKAFLTTGWYCWNIDAAIPISRVGNICNRHVLNLKGYFEWHDLFLNSRWHGVVGIPQSECILLNESLSVWIITGSTFRYSTCRPFWIVRDILCVAIWYLWFNLLIVLLFAANPLHSLTIHGWICEQHIQIFHGDVWKKWCWIS